MLPRLRSAVLGLALISLLLACGDGSAIETPPPATDLAGTQPGTATVVRGGPLQGYYFEASVKTVTQARSNSEYLVIKAWWDAPARTRWELQSSNDDRYRRILLIDGDEQWFYEPGTNTYTHGKQPPATKGKPYPLPSNYQLGLIELVQGVTATRSDTYLGRDVEIYETSTPQVKTEWWVDKEFGVVLRQLVTSSAPNLVSFTAQVEKVLYNPRFDARAFVFEPPPGAREASSAPAAQSGGTITPSRGLLNVPPGLLSPSYIPAGYRLETSSQSATAGVTSYIERLLRNEAGATLKVQETYRPGGLPDSMIGGSEVAVGDSKGYLTRGAGQIILVAYRKDVIVVLTATALSVDELRRIVESMD